MTSTKTTAGRSGPVAFVGLVPAAGTAPLRAARDADRARPRGRGLLRARPRHPHEPVQVTGQGTLRLEHVPGLLEALCEHVRLQPDREAGHAVELVAKRAA